MFLKVPILEDAAQFKRHITAPIDYKKVNIAKGYRNLRTLLSSICLRRTKAVLPMAQFTTFTQSLDFTQNEREEYAQIERICKEALDLAVSGHKVKEAHQNVLEILLRLRLFCNNGSVYDGSGAHFSGEFMDPGEALSLLEQTGQAACYYCLCDVSSITRSNDDESALLTACHRVICSDCISSWKTAFAKRHPVTVVRYIMNKTVEKNVQNKQFRKLKLAHGAFAHGKGEDAKLKFQMLRELILPE
ncbi:hypothetical protein H2199_008968 [Coniosporium tulheliwenetii]|uniref:Uncharacterized protein n=1 Tax=Coniosporium tulheliwenetii TaxID=3383036 RepID=A0ACC2YH14_9PEZI|nr:hypothetical protein H2199_008968 [Cladosporium sp. JES 115]